jgi:hypothetical protein
MFRSMLVWFASVGILTSSFAVSEMLFDFGQSGIA